MAAKNFFLFLIQIVLLTESLCHPALLTSQVNQPTIATQVVPSSILSGSGSQIITPSYSQNWQQISEAVPIVTEIKPSLQFGEINVDGDMPVAGYIQISGSFPVFGNVAVDGAVPSYGTAYVDTGSVFPADCSCLN